MTSKNVADLGESNSTLELPTSYHGRNMILCGSSWRVQARYEIQGAQCTMKSHKGSPLTVLKYPKDPELQAFIQRYLSETTRVSRSFLHFVAECLDLSPTTFDQFLGNMHRLKFVKYPPAPPGSQGVGPHKDSTGLFTFLFQDQIGGLQVLARSGQWIDAPPIEGSLVVNVQQGFEAITGGLCPATIHRVIVCGYPRNRELTDTYHCQGTDDHIKI